MICWKLSVLSMASPKPGVSTTVRRSLTPLSSISTVDASNLTVFFEILSTASGTLRSGKQPQVSQAFFFRRFGGNVGEWTFRKIEFWQISWVLAAKMVEFSINFLEFLKNFLEYWSKLAIKACGMYFAVVICSFSEDTWHLWLLKDPVLRQEFPKNWVSAKFLLEFWRNFPWVLIKLSFGALEFWSKRRKKSLF